MAVIGVATSIGLWLLGIPMPIMLGMLAGLVSFVPTLGAILAIVPAVLVSFQQGPAAPFYVVGLYLIIQAVENNLLTPIVQQKAVDVPPVLMIIAQFFMGLFVGALGVAIATPMAAAGIVWVRKLYIEPYIKSEPKEKTFEESVNGNGNGNGD
jgi:predicted PurR-regulated permease PerM